MRVCSDIEYTIDKTLTGKKLMIGSKPRKLIVRFAQPHIQDVIDFTKTYQERAICVDELSEKEKVIAANFDKAGFLTSSEHEIRGFNEFQRLGRKIFRIHPKSSGLFFGLLNHTWGSVLIALLYILLGVSIFMFRGLFPTKIDYIHMQIADILITVLLFPVLVLALHEMGHLLFARLMGVEVEEVSFGTFFIYPLVLVQYRGINLNSQRQRLVVILGGIFVNALLGLLGLLIKARAPGLLSPAVIDIWIMANLSYVLTNLSFIGMTDGYFFFTILLGQTDLRMRGYKYLSALLQGRRKDVEKSYGICAIALCIFYLYSLFNIALQIVYWTSLFSVHSSLVLGALLLIVLIVSARFLHRIKKAFSPLEIKRKET